MLAARARRRRLIRRLSIVTPVAALFFYLAVRTRPTPPSATPTLASRLSLLSSGGSPPTLGAVAATPKPPAVVATPKKPPAVDVAAALAVLSKRVRKVLARNKATTPVTPLPRWSRDCDVDCRLATCTKPFARIAPDERQRSRARRTWLRHENVTGGPAVRPARRVSDRDEAKYWRRRVDESGVAAYQRRHAAAYARRGGPVPCTEPAYPDFIIGLREHLPPADAPRPPVDADAAALQKTLHDLQFGGQRCDESLAAYGIGRVGIGGVLKLLAMPFTAAFDRRKPFVVKHARLEPSARSLWELIEPFSNCTRRVPDEREWVPSDTPNFRRGKYAPFPFGHRGHFWWTSQLSRFMFRPRPALQTLIDEELAKIPRPFIGLQVRHGDKCRGDRPDGPGASAESFRTLDDRNRPEDMRIECGSFEEYMIHVQRLFELYGITTATDDADVVDRARRDPCYAHFDFYFQKYERLITPQYSYVDPDSPEFVQYGLEECQNAGHRKDRLKCPLDRDRFDETRSMVVDLGVLAKADAFVGSLWSNVGRLAYELSAADKGCLPPLISRDVGWCSVDGQLQDGTVYGHLNC